MVICEYWACHSNMVVDVFLPWSDVSVGKDFLTCMLDVLLPWLDIKAEEDEYLHAS